MADQQAFVILALQRVGSNMLVSALDSHPEIRCHGELFRRKNVRRIGPLKVLNQVGDDFKDDEARFADPQEFVERVFGLDKDVPFVGFKMMLLQHPEFCKVLIKDSSFKKVLLHRQNILACYSSELIAKVTGQGKALHGMEIKEAKVDFDKDRFLNYWIKRKNLYQKTRESLHKAGQAFIDVEYTSLVNGCGISAVTSFLGAKSDVEPEAKTKKRNPSNVLDRFNNPDDVVSFVAKNKRNYWLQDNP